MANCSPCRISSIEKADGQALQALPVLLIIVYVSGYEDPIKHRGSSKNPPRLLIRIKSGCARLQLKSFVREAVRSTPQSPFCRPSRTATPPRCPAPIRMGTPVIPGEYSGYYWPSVVELYTNRQLRQPPPIPCL